MLQAPCISNRAERRRVFETSLVTRRSLGPIDDRGLLRDGGGGRICLGFSVSS